MASLTASMLSYSTCTNPLGRGRNGSSSWGLPVADQVDRVRPWKEFCAVITSYAPFLCSLPYLRASLNAPSLASAPLLQKNTLSRQLLSTSNWASWSWGTV